MTTPVGRSPDRRCPGRGRDPAPDDGGPVAKSGLKVTWGQATTVLIAGRNRRRHRSTWPIRTSDSFVSLLATSSGRHHRVRHRPGTADAADQRRSSSFEAPPVGFDPGWTVRPGGVAAVVVDQATCFSRCGCPGPAARPAVRSATIPPALFDPLDPAAWDDLPTMLAGEEWAATVAVQLDRRRHAATS